LLPLHRVSGAVDLAPPVLTEDLSFARISPGSLGNFLRDPWISRAQTGELDCSASVILRRSAHDQRSGDGREISAYARQLGIALGVAVRRELYYAAKWT
jgi:hypothetical protein